MRIHPVRMATVLGLIAAWTFGHEAANAVNSAGPTLIDVGGGTGNLGGGDGGTVDFAADDLRIGTTKVKAARAPKAPKKASLVIGNEDWDAVDGGPEDLDPDPDTIRTAGSIIINGTLTVDGDENLVVGEGGIFVTETGSIVRNGNPGEDDGAPGLADDEIDGDLDLGVVDGVIVIRGLIDLSGDDEGDAFGLNGGGVVIAASLVYFDGGRLLLTGGDTTGLLVEGGAGGFVSINASAGTVTDDGTPLVPSRKHVISLSGTSIVDIGGGSSSSAAGGRGGEGNLRAFDPTRRTLVSLLGTIDGEGGDGDIGGGADGLNIFATDVDLAGSLLFAGGAGDQGTGGPGGHLCVDCIPSAEVVGTLDVAGSRKVADDVSILAVGGSSFGGGGESGGSGGVLTFHAGEGDIDFDGVMAARGGPGDFGGDGGGVMLRADRGDLNMAGTIDVSGAHGADGDGGDAGMGLGLPDPAEVGDSAHANAIGVFFVALDGSILNQGSITAVGGDAANAVSGLGGSGGNGADVMFLVDDLDPEDEAGDSDGPSPDGVELLDNTGGSIVNEADIFTNGGDASDGSLTGDFESGGDAGDVTLDADPNDDEISGRRAKKSLNEGDIFADGGNAATSGGATFAQGGDGGDVLFRTAGEFCNEGEIEQDSGLDAGSPASPAEDGETTGACPPKGGSGTQVSADVTLVPSPPVFDQPTMILVVVRNPGTAPLLSVEVEVFHFDFSLGARTIGPVPPRDSLTGDPGELGTTYDVTFPDRGPNQKLNVFVDGKKVLTHTFNVP